MTNKQNLYFIAIVPPPQVCEEVTKIKEDIASRFQSKAALKVIPHITLKAPFKLTANHHEYIIQWFQHISTGISSFQQELKNFAAFHNKNYPVIYVNPTMRLPLHDLQQKVLSSFRKTYPDEPVMDLEIQFKPHMTVAYRDLQPHLFAEAWKEYETKKFSATFEVNSFRLLQHDGRMWNTISTYSLKSYPYEVNSTTTSE